MDPIFLSPFVFFSLVHGENTFRRENHQRLLTVIQPLVPGFATNKREGKKKKKGASKENVFSLYTQKDKDGEKRLLGLKERGNKRVWESLRGCYTMQYYSKC